MEARKFTVELTPVARLLRLPGASVQRLLDAEHVARMVAEQVADYEKHGAFSLLQAVTLARVPSGELRVLDGQHRIRAFEALAARGYPVGELLVPAVVYALGGGPGGAGEAGEVLEYYQRVNQHRPVHPVEVSPDWAAFYRVFCEGLRRLYGAYFKAGAEHASCRRPYVSVERLLTYARKRDLAAEVRAACGDAAQLVARVEALNEYLRAGLAEELTTAKDVRIHAKCGEVAAALGVAPCYLGMYRQFEWLEAAVHLLRAGPVPAAETLRPFALGRLEKPAPRVPRPLRLAVWEKRNKGLRGPCYACGEEIAYDAMQCGHVVAQFFGGPTTLENLEPICAACNLDMGVMNLEAYRAACASVGGARSSEHAADRGADRGADRAADRGADERFSERATDERGERGGRSE